MNKNLITLFEYEISNEKFNLKEKELKEIRNLNKIHFPNSKDNEFGIFNLVSKNRIKATKFVGIVQIGNKTIEVIPKILSVNNKNNKEDKNDLSSIRKNLLFMLSYTKNLKIKETDISQLSKNSNLFESIIYLFAKNLIELLKKDLIKNYVSKEENTNFLKGKLLMTKHLRYNLFNKAKFYSKFDEFTEDNLLNQIFKATINKLIPFTKNNKNFKLLSECDFILQDVTLKNISSKDCEKIKFNRLNLQYESIFNLAKLLLFGNSIELNSKDTKTYSLMFNMNKLFEEFIFIFIKKICNNENYLIQSEKPRKYLFKKSPKFELRPDITISCLKCNKINLIIDTKYKKINNVKSEKYGVSISDIYQMFVYSKVYNCKNIILLYPEYETKVNEILESEFNFRVFIKTVNLHIDLIKEKDKLINELDSILNRNKNE